MRGLTNKFHGLLLLLAFITAGWSGYLAYGSYLADNIAGCGPDSGCAAVLASRWSRWLGIPVSLGAVAVYGSITILLCSSLRHPAIAVSLHALALVAVGAAAWFVGLQLLLIKITCVHCMMVHGLGSLLAMMLLLTLPRWSGWRGWLPCLAGGLIVLALIGGQAWGPAPPQHRVIQWGDGRDLDSGPQAGMDREISMLNGLWRLRPSQQPMLGSLTADHVLVMLTDYACIHCRVMHQYLQQAIRAYPGKLGVVLLPVPLDGRCNPLFPVDDGRFKDACALAALALAVHHADATKFASMDHWLFENQGHLTVEQAHAFAAGLLGEDVLKNAIAASWPHEQLQRNVRFYQMAAIGRLPALIHGPGMVLGRPGTYGEFVQSLREDLHLPLD